MVFLGMHLSVWIGLLGLIVYSVNIIVVNHYIKIKANDTYYLLRKTEIPTVIVECGFLSNTEEAEKLMKEVPKLKWTLPVGVISLLVTIFGFGWTILRLVGIL